MIFVPGTPRKIKQDEAARIATAMRRRVELAGVFQNAQLDHVVRTVQGLELTLVQLHGDEGPAFCSEVARRTGARVIKAARIGHQSDVAALGAYRTDFHLMDGPGSGQPFEWSLARKRPGARPPLIVAGGLTPDNVGDAIDATRLFAVDVSSGVEASPGVKDPILVSAFAQAVAATEVAA
jgi:phosphoribosylanthranilate isomerase